MSHLRLDLGHEKRHRPRRTFGCLAVLLALLVLVGGGYVVASKGIDAIQARLSPPPDYPGPGTGTVLVQVHKGDVASDIGSMLKRKGVVKSVQAFTDAARDDPRSTGIQVGFYEMRHKMSAEQALGVLVDPDNLVQAAVTIPEGYTVEQIVERLAESTDFSAKQYRTVLRHPDEIGLPDYAKGNPEGYLFPATYTIRPGATPESILAKIVDRFRQSAEKLHLEQRAEGMGYTPHEVMTIASLVETEANPSDRGKVARVIYNRLETDATNHLLQIDATVNYALGRKLGLGLTQEDLDVDSPYNTRKYPGLPPGPIASPGDAAIKAALHPADGPWVYYVTVNLDTGKTKFTDDYDEFLHYKQQLHRWCETSDRC